MQNWIDIAYLIAACLFVLGIKGLTKPKTAVRGNLLAATGMGVAAVVTLLNEHIVTYEIIIAGVVVGGLCCVRRMASVLDGGTPRLTD